MTLTVLYRGIVEIVGGHDVGKTIAALQAGYPYDKTVFVDDDVKGDGTVRQMRDNGVTFGQYINLGEKRVALGDTPTADALLNKIVLPTVQDICRTHHELIIWDTWRICYQSARQYVEKNQSLFNNVVKFQGSSIIIQGLISRVARMIEQRQINLLRTHCDLLIITHHLKDKYEANVRIGETPESSTTFSEVCNMRMWLRRNPQSKVPIVLFLKRPNLPKVVDGFMQFVNLVPMKITPTANEQSVWEALHRYELEPLESRQPREDETPTAEELAMISNTLTLEQKQYVLEMAKYAKSEEEMVKDLIPAQPEPVKYMAKDLDAIPTNGITLITSCMKEFGMNGETLAEVTSKSLPEIMAMDQMDVTLLWGTIKERYGK
jgi:hypothetical protein